MSCTICRLKKREYARCIFSDCPNNLEEKTYKNPHGGVRKGAGRKSQYDEETKTISFRVPKSLIEPITKYVKSAIAKSKK